MQPKKMAIPARISMHCRQPTNTFRRIRFRAAAAIPSRTRPRAPSIGADPGELGAEDKVPPDAAAAVALTLLRLLVRRRLLSHGAPVSMNVVRFRCQQNHSSASDPTTILAAVAEVRYPCFHKTDARAQEELET
jgi:hypothetical protein